MLFNLFKTEIDNARADIVRGAAATMGKDLTAADISGAVAELKKAATEIADWQPRMDAARSVVAAHKLGKDQLKQALALLAGREEAAEDKDKPALQAQFQGYMGKLEVKKTELKSSEDALQMAQDHLDYLQGRYKEAEEALKNKQHDSEMALAERQAARDHLEDVMRHKADLEKAANTGSHANTSVLDALHGETERIRRQTAAAEMVSNSLGNHSEQGDLDALLASAKPVASPKGSLKDQLAALDD